MTTLGEAFIEVHADCKPFARELAECLKAALAIVDKKVKSETVRTGEKISENIVDGMDRKGNLFTRFFRKVGRSLGNESNDWVKKFRAPFDRMAKGNFILTRLFGEAALAIGGALRHITRFTSAILSLVGAMASLGFAVLEFGVKSLLKLAGAATDTATAAAKLGIAWASVVQGFAALFAEVMEFLPALAALVALMIALVGVLSFVLVGIATILAPFATLLNFALALPAALSLILAIVLPLVIAMHSLGDAMKAVFEKDPKKFAEQFKALSPVMQQLVSVLRPFRKTFEHLADVVQAGFILPILTRLRPALKAMLPVLTQALAMVSQALGNIALAILRVVSSRAFLDIISNTMGQIALFLQNNTAAITTLIMALARAAQAALPTVLTLVTKFMGFLTQFATWIEGAITDGRFQKWLDTAIRSAQRIWDLIKALIGLFAELFDQTDEGGRHFLAKITETVNKITAWLKSPEGKQGISDLVDLTIAFAGALEEALKIVRDILDVFLTIYHAVVGIVELVQWLNNNGPSGNVSGKKGAVKSFSGGGVVARDELAMVHRGEPILDPHNSVARNRSILAEAGLLSVLAPAAPVVNVYLGTERLDERVDYRIGRSNRSTATLLTTGPRT